MVRHRSSTLRLLALLLLCLAFVGAAFLASGGFGESRPVDTQAGRTTVPGDAMAQVAASTEERTERPETVTERNTASETPTAPDRETTVVGDGPTATKVTVVDTGRPGPTVVVVGGVHGNERAGYRAAHRVAGWDVERGTLVVVPEANPRAIANGTRKVDGRDLNAQFPVGERPASAQARVVWGVIAHYGADVVVDLHSSTGIYGVDGGVGQAVFPTVTGRAVEHADAAISRVNGRYDLTGNHSFRRGNVMGKSGLTLVRKVAGDANETAYIVETTQQNTDLETRVEWTTAMVWELLKLHGLDPSGRRGTADTKASPSPSPSP